MHSAEKNKKQRNKMDDSANDKRRSSFVASVAPPTDYVQAEFTRKRRTSIVRALDDTWDAYTEPTTKQIFYHNRVMDVSTWERPSSSSQPATKVTQKTIPKKITSNSRKKAKVNAVAKKMAAATSQRQRRRRSQRQRRRSSVKDFNQTMKGVDSVVGRETIAPPHITVLQRRKNNALLQPPQPPQPPPEFNSMCTSLKDMLVNEALVSVFDASGGGGGERNGADDAHQDQPEQSEQSEQSDHVKLHGPPLQFNSRGTSLKDMLVNEALVSVFDASGSGGGGGECNATDDDQPEQPPVTTRATSSQVHWWDLALQAAQPILPSPPLPRELQAMLAEEAVMYEEKTSPQKRSPSSSKTKEINNTKKKTRKQIIKCREIVDLPHEVKTMFENDRTKSSAGSV